MKLLINRLNDLIKKWYWWAWHPLNILDYLIRVRTFNPSLAGRYVGYITTAGMGNRLRSHLIALAIAKRTGRKLVVRWTKNSHCGAHYNDLYEGEFPERCFYRSIRVLKYNKGDYTDQADRNDGFKEDLLLLDHSWQYVDFDYMERSIGEIDLSLAIKPEEHLKSIIDLQLNTLGAEWIGMHIRRGDFKKIGQAIPLSRYIEKLDQEFRSSEDERRVFIASDSDEEELADALKRYGNRVVRRESAGRDNLVGMENAVVDLFILCAAKKLILTRGSTFGELAALISKVDYEFA